MGIFLFPFQTYAQEEESAEISLEEYSDAFQENFFQALKHYGIENYDRAINYLLECKKLKPENEVVDFELGKNYFKLDQYFKAEEYLLNAVKAVPDNIWYLDALFEIYKVQNNTEKTIEIAEQLAAKNSKYKENLIMLYIRSAEYEKALELVEELDKELGATTTRKVQRTYLMNLVENKKNNRSRQTVEVTEKKEKTANPLIKIREEIQGFIDAEDYKKLLKLTGEAVEVYPSQAFFHYANGLALNESGKFKDAIASLELALDFLIDDGSLKKNIHTQLAKAHKALGNDKKANEYLKKGKEGS